MPLSQLLQRSSGELQAELQLILNAVVEGLCGMDALGKVTFCNDALLRMTGYRSEELIGNNLHALLHHSRRDGTKYPEEECGLRKALDAGQEIHAVGEFLWRKDGSSFPAEYWAHPLRQPSSRTASVVTIQDISERERAIEALRTSEERFRQISNNIDEAFYLVDVIADHMVYASPAFETITGHSCQEVCERPSPWCNLAIPEHREEVIADYLRLVAGQETRSEYQIRHRDGSTRWIKNHAKPIWGANGEVSMVAGVAEDITEIHEARDTLRQSEEKFRRILTSVPDVAWTSDRERRTTYVSPKVEAVLGYTKEEFCGAGGNLRSGLIHPEDFGRVNRGYRSLFEGGRAFDEEYRIRRKDGTWIWIQDRATGTHEEGGVLYADGVFSDITGRKQAEAELQSKTAFLEAQANSTIDGILVVAGNGRRLMQNQRYVEMFHVPPEILANKENDAPLLQHVASLIKDSESFVAKIKHLYRNPSETSRDEIELKDGRVMDRYSAPVVDEGTYYGRIWTFRDITERKRNEDTLQQLSTAVEQSPVSVVITNPQGHISYVNVKFTEVTGYHAEEVLGQSPRILKSGLTSPDVYRNLWSTIQQGQEWRGELCNKKKNGELYWEVATIRPITNAKGAITHYLAIKEDITERRRAEEALKASEKRYRQLFERNLAGVLRTTLEGRILECNQSAARMFGYELPEEVLILPATNLYHRSSDREAFLTKLKSDRNVTNYEMRFRHKDGSSLWVIASFSLVDDDAGTGRIIEGTLVDITERKRAEEAGRESSETVRILLDSIPEAVYGIDLQGNCTFCNPSCLQLLGYEGATDLLGKNMHALIHHTRDDGTAYPVEECHIYKAFRRGQGTHIDNEVLWRRDGTSFAGEYWSHPLERGGKVVGTVVTFVDIRERKRTQEALRESERRYRQLFERNLAGVFRTTLDGRVLECNAAAAHLFGCDSPEELLDLPIATFYRSASDREALLTRLNSEKSVTNHEMKFQRKNGDPAWAMLNLSLVDDDAGNGRDIEGTFVDITERKHAEEELHGSRQMLQSILDAIPQRVFWKDRNCVYLGCNRAFATDAGIEEPAAIIGKSDFELAWAGTAELYCADDRMVMEEGKAKLNFEERQSRPDGSVLWLQTNKLPLRDREGKVTGILGTYEDVTKRKETEQILQRSEEKFRQLAENIHEVFWMMSPKADEILYVSPAYEQVWGRTCESLYRNPMAWAEAIHPDDLERAHTLFARQMQGERVESEYRIRTPDGQEKWISDRAFPIRDKDGQIIRVVGIAEETTERKRADKELRRTKYSLENASDAVFWIDSQARIVYATEAASRSLGHSREELLSLSVPDIDPLFPREAWPAVWEEVKTRGSKTFETQHKSKDGRVYPVEVTANYLEFDGQEYSFAFARDITERRALESQLRHAQKLEGIGQLAAGIAHEINTPTQFVTDNLTFLRDSWKATHELLEEYRSAIRNAAGTLPESIAAALNEAERNCDLDFIVEEVPRAIDQGLDGAHRVARIVRAMKEFSHPDSAEKTATDLNRAIESTITVARSEWKYVAEVVTELDETLPRIVCYPGDINQVILNLLVNAAHAIKDKVKDGDKGQITVGTRTHGKFVQISVADTGSGIPEAIRTRIFEPFFTTKEVGKGTGQGLSLAHTVVVKKHSGKIWFETEIGVGTTFFIDLPIQAADQGKED